MEKVSQVVNHRFVKEYDAVRDLVIDFKTMPPETRRTGAILHTDKHKAIMELKHQMLRYQKFASRVFWYKEVRIVNGGSTFILFECLV